MDERLSKYLVDVVLKDEQIKNPYQDVENVSITKVDRMEVNGEMKVFVEYVYDLYSRLDREWRLTRKPGRKNLCEDELKPYYRDIRIDQILE